MRYRLLAHSAKGTEWDENKRKYIGKEDGKYYYPDDYVGGRHLPKDKQELSGANKGEPSGWESKLYNSLEETFSRGVTNLDPKQIQEMLLFGKNKDGSSYDNFKVALEEVGVNTDKIDPKVLNAMRYKVVEHYKERFEKERENFDKEGNRIGRKKTEAFVESKSSGSSRSKKSSNKKNDNKSNKKDLAIDKVDKSRGNKMDKERKNTSSYWSTRNADLKKKQKVYGGQAKHGMEIPRYVIRPTGIHW